MKRSRGTIVVFAKRPEPGQVKTRMVPPLSPQQASDLYAELLADVLETTGIVAARLALEPVLSVHPPRATRALARLAPAQFRIVAQRGADLGERLDWALREAFAAGAGRVLVRGSDSPILDERRVSEAVDALDSHDMVVCPDLDGGYNLIGLRAPAPRLFDRRMSTATVLEETLAAATASGLRAHVLEASFDLDVAADLSHLARARRDARSSAHPPDRGVLVLCQRTLAYLDAQQLWP